MYQLNAGVYAITFRNRLSTSILYHNLLSLRVTACASRSSDSHITPTIVRVWHRGRYSVIQPEIETRLLVTQTEHFMFSYSVLA